MLDNGIKACLIQIGIILEFYFYPERDCRRGDPLFFLLCVEILGILIRNEINTLKVHLQIEKDTRYDLATSNE